jgi:ABC-2 type transport system ATP-binding protein
MSSPTVAALAHASKSFGDRHAVVDLSFEAEPGMVVALLGPNGAGKTTALSLLVGLRRPDRGRAFLFGSDPRRAATRRSLGVTPQEAAFPGTLRVREIVELVRAHYPRPAPTAALLGRFGLAELAARQAGGLSGGERRRLSVALAFVGSPALVILDEPTTGLDIESRRETWNAIRSYSAGGGTVVLTTHHLEEAEALATHAVVIDHGRVSRHGPVAELKGSSGLGRVRFRSERIPLDLEGRVVAEDGWITVYTSRPTAVIRTLIGAGARLEHLEVTPLSLEEALEVERDR